MNFKEFNLKIQSQFKRMCATGKLFRSSITGQQVWDLYLSSFELDPVFIDPNSSTHNCNLCKNFIRRYGNIVAINENYEVMSIFDVNALEPYDKSANAVSKTLKNAPISEVFFETFEELNSLPYESCNKNMPDFKLGIAKNVKRYTKEEAEKYGVVKPNEIRTFNHLHLYLPKQFVDQSGKSIDQIMAGFRDAKNVFERAMKEIPLDTLNLVRDLINQGSLLDGQTHLYKIKQIIPLKQQYDNLDSFKKSNWCWMMSYNLPYAKFKNELIGVLCSELAEGEESVNAAAKKAKREEILSLIAEKQKEEMKGKSIEDLQKELENI